MTRKRIHKQYPLIAIILSTLFILLIAVTLDINPSRAFMGGGLVFLTFYMIVVNYKRKGKKSTIGKRSQPKIQHRRRKHRRIY
ncbi:hypothetical protein [Algivirga pacifica]|uniref:hypothetical protein n=1 Tax=Algivirga pacifica TaxID=1162670 RepID=UPI0031E998F0